MEKHKKKTLQMFGAEGKIVSELLEIYRKDPPLWMKRKWNPVGTPLVIPEPKESFPKIYMIGKPPGAIYLNEHDYNYLKNALEEAKAKK